MNSGSVKKQIIKFFAPSGVRILRFVVIVFLFYVYLFTVHAERSVNKNSGSGEDTLEFSGYKWLVKESYNMKTGPGENYFSSTKENVFVDNSGKLHLRLTNRNDKWYCPEVTLIPSLGYGKYFFTIEPLKEALDKDIVIGIFLYDHSDTSNFHKEVDIEFSKWGNDTAMNSQYVIQPKESQALRFQTDFSKCTKHMIELKQKKMLFSSFYESGELGNRQVKISDGKIIPDYDYETSNEKITINVWLYRTVEPYNLKEFEVVISKFEFKPFWYLKILKPGK